MNNKGFTIPSEVKSLSTSQTNWVGLDSNSIRGGLYTVNNITERNNISSNKRKFGMISYVINIDKYFQLKNTDNNLSNNSNWFELNLNTNAPINDEWVNSILELRTSPPISPVIGSRYLINSGSTGIWTGLSDYIAQWVGSNWSYTQPRQGLTTKIIGNNKSYFTYIGNYPSGSWLELEFIDIVNNLGIDVQKSGYTYSIGLDMSEGTGIKFGTNSNSLIINSNIEVGLGLTASYGSTISIRNIKDIRNGIINGASFSGTPSSFNVIFDQPILNDYTISVIGEDIRTWSILGKTFSGFSINSNSTELLNGNIYWQIITI